jgi:hypothetical protein
VFPGLSFHGFHPDSLYVFCQGHRAVKGPLEDYHSAIVFNGYLAGLEPATIVNLFRDSVFEQLGYLDRYTLEVEALRHRYSTSLPGLIDRLPELSRRGSFMHAITHPTIRTLFTMAEEVLRQLNSLNSSNLPRPGADLPIQDVLAASISYPVYPSIADRLGISGSLRFKPHNTYKTLSLDEFVHASLGAYQRFREENPEAVFWTYESDDAKSRMKAILKTA